MADTNKKSLSYKLQKNPILLVFGIIAIAVALFIIINVTSGIKEKINSNKETEITEITTLATTIPETEAVEQLQNVTLYNKNIVSYTIDKTEVSVSLNVKYKDIDSLLKTHNASDINNQDYIPVFCFYNGDGTQFSCPGELKLDSKSNAAIYTLNVINDFANAIALTDEVTVTYESVLDLPFNICLQSKSSGEMIETLMGTHSKKCDDSEFDYRVNLVNAAQGVKKAELTKTDEFMWLDIYFDDVNAYTQLNNDFITNFVRFGVSYNGVTYKRDFIVTEYDSLNMIRCKFDSYSMEGLAKEMGKSDLSVEDVFTDYPVSVWTSDYDVETVLFGMNGFVSVPSETPEETEGQ